jgi:hypothetical protein
MPQIKREAFHEKNLELILIFVHPKFGFSPILIQFQEFNKLAKRFHKDI